MICGLQASAALDRARTGAPGRGRQSVCCASAGRLQPGSGPLYGSGRESCDDWAPPRRSRSRKSGARSDPLGDGRWDHAVGILEHTER